MIENSEVCNFADGNTIYEFDDSIGTILRLFKGDINNALECFQYNKMVANPDKFQVNFLGLEKGQTLNPENGIPMRTAEEVKLIGITIDSKLRFQRRGHSISTYALNWPEFGPSFPIVRTCTPDTHPLLRMYSWLLDPPPHLKESF